MSLKERINGELDSIKKQLGEVSKVVSGEELEHSVSSAIDAGLQSVSNQIGSLQSELATKQDKDSAFSGDYNDLQNKPTIPSSKSQIGLGNVDDTSDLAKPISTLTQQALTTKQDKDSAFSGNYHDLKNKPTIPLNDAISVAVQNALDEKMDYFLNHFFRSDVPNSFSSGRITWKDITKRGMTGTKDIVVKSKGVYIINFSGREGHGDYTSAIIQIDNSDAARVDGAHGTGNYDAMSVSWGGVLNVGQKITCRLVGGHEASATYAGALSIVQVSKEK